MRSIRRYDVSIMRWCCVHILNGEMLYFIMLTKPICILTSVWHITVDIEAPWMMASHTIYP